ncbi:GroES-like protein [Dacryopinax primogenitus]|uniref:GroES-like protein n=1 Tax=Dacryopinax primogenitus (strain DJM 731) TaxID=1858805 RepID=M5FSI4_DACPD|nr:GroES-like protein [Dacryopinax primogenitus]EJU00406.1 GroES-like protein [Dacryopinax primogenitus]
MRGLQIVEFGKPYVLNEHIPVPVPGKGEILIKIAVAGYCHTETMVLRGDFAALIPWDPLPQIPSHEAAGYIAAIGPGVSDNWNVGQRVACLNYRGWCGTCEDCGKGMQLYCDNLKSNGTTVDGAMAEYMLADPGSTLILPDNVPFEKAAPLMCAGATIYSGVKRAGLKAGQVMAIVGVGALGHLGVQFAKCLGYKVVAVDAREAPLELVRRLKHPPDITINSTEGYKGALAKIPWPIDATLVATDAIPAYDFGLEITRKHGLFVDVGQPFDPIPVHYRHLIWRNIQVVGVSLGTMENTREMVQLFADNDLECSTRVYAMEEIEKLIEDTHDRNMAGKMVVKISD